MQPATIFRGAIVLTGAACVLMACVATLLGTPPNTTMMIALVGLCSWVVVGVSYIK